MSQHNPPPQPDHPGDAMPPAGGTGYPPGQVPQQAQPGEGSGTAPSLGQPPAPGAPPPPGQPEGGKKSGRAIKIILSVAGAAILGLGLKFGLGSVVGGLFGDNPPKVGDCLTGELNPNDRKVVDCGDGDAAWSVVGSDGQWVKGQFDSAPLEQICTAHVDWHEALWWGETTDADANGEVFCLVPAV